MRARLRALLRKRWLWAVAAAGAAAIWVRCGPLPSHLFDERAEAASASTTVVDRHGETLFESRSSAGTRGERIEAGAIPPLVEAATLAAEDGRFDSHPGIDPLSTARALWHNLRAGRVVEGGSTITQQVAKLLLIRAEGPTRRGWSAKAREAVIALRLEHRFSKREILAMYLNLAPYGNQITGAERASRAYFGRVAGSLTPAEAAFLAALPQQPSRFNPWKPGIAPVVARSRRILDRMRILNRITADDYRLAYAERISLHRESRESLAPHFVERVLGSIDAAAPRRPRIVTTLDAALQRQVRGIIDARRADLARHQAHNVAVVVLDNRTGEWLAWEGSGNYFDADHGGAIDGAITPRQPGSALKPFTYAAAFERGYHPARVLADVPSQFPTAEPGVLYAPRNYDDVFRGPLLARAALAGSENVPAVALAADIGVPSVLRVLRETGLSSLDANAAHYGLGLTLGNAEVKLSELVAAYAMLARGGVTVAPTFEPRVRAAGMPAASERRLLSARSAFWLADILADDEARAFIFGRGSSLEFPFTVAAKTGTSQAYHDNWAIGFTREVTVGVWVGNFDRRPLVGSSGVTGAGPIFHDVMLAAVEHVRGALPIGDRAAIVATPSDVRRGTVCALSGLSPGAACLRRSTEWLPVESAPPECTWHRHTPAGIVTVWPEEYRAWSRTTDAGLHRVAPVTVEAHAVVAEPLQPRSASSRPVNSGGEFEIASPLAGATFLRDPTLRAEFQSLTLRTRGGSGPVEWRVNGELVGTAADGDVVRWPIVSGQHQLEARDARGRQAQIRIVVR